MPLFASACPRIVSATFLACTVAGIAQSPTLPTQLFGYRDFAAQARLDGQFLAVPEAGLAGQHLKALTAQPHWASSPGDYATVQYVAAKFKAAGLDTAIVPFCFMLK